MGRRPLGLGKHHKCISDMMRLDLGLEQVARHVVGGGDAPGLGAGLDEVVGQQAGSDPVGIDAVDPDTGTAKLQRQLPDQKKVAAFGSP
jgi:hypothetical protein